MSRITSGSLCPSLKFCRFAVAAGDLVAQPKLGRMVCPKAGKMETVSLDEALEEMKFIDRDREVVHAACAVGVTFGDSA